MVSPAASSPSLEDPASPSGEDVPGNFPDDPSLAEGGCLDGQAPIDPACMSGLDDDTADFSPASDDNTADRSPHRSAEAEPDIDDSDCSMEAEAAGESALNPPPLSLRGCRQPNQQPIHITRSQ